MGGSLQPDGPVNQAERIQWILVLFRSTAITKRVIQSYDNSNEITLLGSTSHAKMQILALEWSAGFPEKCSDDGRH